MTDYQSLVLPYRRSIDQDAATPVRHGVVVVGAGPVGLTLALDLAQQGIPVVVLDDDDRLSHGSRAICFAKRTLEIWDRLGVGQCMVDKGVSWRVGKVFHREELVYRFDLLPESGHRRPAFINLQQYYCEGFLFERVRTQPLIDLRWRNKLVGMTQTDTVVQLDVDTPDGSYRMQADYVVACDGSRSTVRRLLGLESKGQVFRDRFLIADVTMTADFPTERWFWFDPPFHPNQSVLLHKQPDNCWRIDFQLGWDADPEAEKRPERVKPRIQALLGENARFEIDWVSVYTFACLRMDAFRHGRVLFSGDAAHGVSPFGARGANSGVQDVDNLAWKLRWVTEGRAPARLLDTYAREREYAADENILNSTRSTDFITPKSAISRVFRDAVLQLAKEHPFARRLVNSGRLSVPCVLDGSELNLPDSDPFDAAMRPGAPATDAPITLNGRQDWLLPQFQSRFTLMCFVADAQAAQDILRARSEIAVDEDHLRVLLVVLQGGSAATPGRHVTIEDRQGLIASRYDATPGTTYLVRPDQHICARWRRFDVRGIQSAIARATCNQP